MGGDILSESFENTGTPGYDNTWSENVGSGSVVDENNSDVARPSTGGDELLKIQNVSPNFNARTGHDSGSERAITYTTCYVQIAAEGLGNTTGVALVTAKDASFETPWRLFLWQTGGGDIKLMLRLYNDGADNYYNYPASGSISLDTWYRVDVKYDSTGNAWEYRVDETPVDSGELTGTLYNPPRHFEIGDVGNSYTVTAYFDLMEVDSSGYVSFGGVTLEIDTSECE